MLTCRCRGARRGEFRTRGRGASVEFQVIKYVFKNKCRCLLSV